MLLNGTLIFRGTTMLDQPSPNQELNSQSLWQLDTPGGYPHPRRFLVIIQVHRNFSYDETQSWAKGSVWSADELAWHQFWNPLITELPSFRTCGWDIEATDRKFIPPKSDWYVRDETMFLEMFKNLMRSI